mmetsp:Transcript_10630/g.28342  ORF Transcript_10630/g.28342 Transcript_10630/m.28342 type:complete len:343 (-) Transcript_10630:260-1288(-)
MSRTLLRELGLRWRGAVGALRAASATERVWRSDAVAADRLWRARSLSLLAGPRRGDARVAQAAEHCSRVWRDGSAERRRDARYVIHRRQLASSNITPEDVERDFYGELGVRVDASEAKVKAAYRRLALQYHPDRNVGNDAALEKFKQISHAYQILSNAESRASYDTLRQLSGHTPWRSSSDSSQSESSDEFMGQHLYNSLFGKIPLDVVNTHMDRLVRERKLHHLSSEELQLLMLKEHFTYSTTEGDTEIKREVFMRADGSRIFRTEKSRRTDGKLQRVSVEEEELFGGGDDFKEFREVFVDGSFRKRALWVLKFTSATVVLGSVSLLVRIILGTLRLIFRR